MAKAHSLKKTYRHQPPLPETMITGKAAQLHRQLKETRHKNRVQRGKIFSKKAQRTKQILNTQRTNYGALLKIEVTRKENLCQDV